MKVSCIHCKAALNAPKEAIGKKCRCPNCKQKFVLNLVGEPALDAELTPDWHLSELQTDVPVLREGRSSERPEPIVPITRKQQRITAGILVMLLVIGLLLGGVLLFGFGGFLTSVTQLLGHVGQSQGVMSRDEFRNAVMGKTMTEVIQAVGRPDTTQDIGIIQCWYYEHRTKDTITGKVDFHAQVTFEGGVVTGVNFA